MVDVSGVDFGAVFDAVPTPYLVLTTDLTIVAVNDAYLTATVRARAELLGQHLFTAFPDNPDDEGAGATRNLGASLGRVLETGHQDTMPLQKYDVPDGLGGFLRRWWSPVNAPVLDRAGSVVLLLHRVEDVTGFVDAQLGGGRDTPDTTAGVAGSALQVARDDLRRAEGDLLLRGQELREALTEQARTARDLAEVAAEARRSADQQAALVDIARALGEAQDEDAVLTVVAGHGRALFGSSSTDLCLRRPGGDVVRVRTTVAPGPGGAAGDGTAIRELPASMGLPSVRTAVTGRPFFVDEPGAVAADFPYAYETYLAAGIGASASVPLQGHDELLGSLTVYSGRERPWPGEDRDLLGAFAALTSQTLDRITARAAERAAGDLAARSAETLQRALLTDLPQPDHLQLHARYLPAADTAQVGGDWYDAVVMPDGATTVVIGDVVGHDMAAAAQMGQLRSMTRTLAWAYEEPPSRVLTRVDHAMAGLRSTTLATCLVGRLEQSDADAATSTRWLRWSSAGHPPPLLITADGAATYLTGGGDVLLGVTPGAERHDHLDMLPCGSTLLLFTDGLVERRDRPLRVGLEVLRGAAARLVAGDRDHSLADLVDALLDDLVHADPAARDPRTSDDIAVLSLRMHPEDRPRPADAGPGDL